MNIKHCCLCGSNQIKEIINLGKSGLANNLEISKQDALKSKEYKLNLLICKDCNHVQLGEEVQPEILFKNYSYETGVSQFFRNHFESYAKNIDSLLNSDNKKIIDIGSNDCILLDSFKNYGFETIGVEPATNLVEKHKKKHYLINDFFNNKVANLILEKFGKVDVVTANNVFAHNRELRGFASSVKELLKDDGIFVVEVQYLVDLVKNGYFDMIYHEHTSYHHIKPLNLMMNNLGLKLVEAKNVNTHGGSIRLIFKKTKIDNKLFNEVINQDEIFNSSINLSMEFLENSINKFKKDFEVKIANLSKKYNCIYGYAAPAKLVTLLSILDKKIVNQIEFIIDDSNLKQNKYLPVSGIPILGTKDAIEKINQRKSACIIFAWNVADDIRERISKSELNPDLIVVPLPKVKEYNEI